MKVKVLNAETTLKKKIWESCLAKQQSLAATAKEAMSDAQEAANEERGSMEEKFESFREQLIRDRDMFARKLSEHILGIDALRQIDVNRKFSKVQLGSVVVTDKQKFFISISLGEIKVGKESFFAISTQSPLFQQMEGKQAGETFEFRNVQNKIINVF